MQIWHWGEVNVWSVKLEAGAMMRCCILYIEAHCAEMQIRWGWQLDIFWCEVFLLEKNNLLKTEVFWGMLISVDTCLAFLQSGFYTLASDLGTRIPEFLSIGFSETCCFLSLKSLVLPGHCNAVSERTVKPRVPGNSLSAKEPRQHIWFRDMESALGMFCILKNYGF